MVLSISIHPLRNHAKSNFSCVFYAIIWGLQNWFLSSSCAIYCRKLIDALLQPSKLISQITTKMIKKKNQKTLTCRANLGCTRLYEIGRSYSSYQNSLPDIFVVLESVISQFASLVVFEIFWPYKNKFVNIATMKNKIKWEK